jgi:hypothetical protein
VEGAFRFVLGVGFARLSLIQANTTKKVIFFAPKMGKTVQENMEANKIPFFKSLNELLEYIKPSLTTMPKPSLQPKK